MNSIEPVKKSLSVQRKNIVRFNLTDDIPTVLDSKIGRAFYVPEGDMPLYLLAQIIQYFL